MLRDDGAGMSGVGVGAVPAPDATGLPPGPDVTALRGARGRRPPIWFDRVLGSDPGLTRLRSALQAVVTIGAAMLVEWGFVRALRPLFLDPAAPQVAALTPAVRQATLTAQHHGVTVIAIMLGAIVGLISSFGAGMFASKRQQVIGTTFIPVPMTAGLSVGLALGDHRVLALALLVVVLTFGAYARRFGPMGFLGGQLAFMGAFFGFNLHGQIAVSGIGWLVAEVAVAAAVALIAQFTVFFPSRAATLRRMVRSYSAREREVASRALEVFDHPQDRAAAVRLHRRLTRLNESALLVDAQLAVPGSVPDRWVPAQLHQRLFDSELALTNMARFAERLAGEGLPAPVHGTVRRGLLAVGVVDLLAASRAARDLLRVLDDYGVPGTARQAPHTDGLAVVTQVLLHRFATSLLGFVEAAEGWRIAVLSGVPADADAQPFVTDVTLFGGWLPGSSAVSAAASMEAGARRSDRVTLAPFTRIAIQICVASSLAITFGSLLSERRFYWAVIATFVTFLGANNAGEQVRKGALRVVGTVAGVFLGAVAVHYVGDNTSLSIVVVLVALFFGLYLLRISYAFMTVGITVMVSQLYVQLDEFSDSLLLLRLAETAIGAAITALVVVLVVPLRTGRVVRVATRQYVQALSAFVHAAVSRLCDVASETELRDAARQIDSAYQALEATLVPLLTPVVGQPDQLRKRIVYAVTASRHYARNLVVDVRGSDAVPVRAREQLQHAAERLQCSLDELVAVGQDGDPDGHTYVRAASLFEIAAGDLGQQLVTSPAHLALRDLQLIDGAMATLAEGVDMDVRALDTADAGETSAAAAADAGVAVANGQRSTR